MSQSLTSIALLVVAALSSGCLGGGGNSINAYGGVRSLDSSDFDDVDELTVYGLDAVVDTSLPWLGVEGGWFHAEDDASSSGTLTDVDLAIDDYFLGVRVTPWKFLIEPYGAVGLNYADGDLDATSGGMSAGDSDSALGYYARLGAGIRLGPVRLGLDARAGLGSDLDLGAVDSDVDSVQLTAFAGIAF